MTKAFISSVLRQNCDLSGIAANNAADALVDSIVAEMKKSGRFCLPGFGTFTVAKKKARKALNPRTGESISVKAGTTVRFKASPVLKATLHAPAPRRSAASRANRASSTTDVRRQRGSSVSI